MRVASEQGAVGTARRATQLQRKKGPDHVGALFRYGLMVLAKVPEFELAQLSGLTTAFLSGIEKCGRSGDASRDASWQCGERCGGSADVSSGNVELRPVRIRVHHDPARPTEAQAKMRERKLPVIESREKFSLERIPLWKELKHSAAKKEGERK